jgi:hypothetical protein
MSTTNKIPNVRIKWKNCRVRRLESTVPEDDFNALLRVREAYRSHRRLSPSNSVLVSVALRHLDDSISRGVIPDHPSLCVAE